MKTALITVVHQRHEHLRRQQAMLERSTQRPDQRVIVAVDDPEIAVIVGSSVDVVIEFDRGSGALPVAAARNAGAAKALADGAELLIFLDVDCLPAPEMVAAYVAAAEAGRHSDALFCGPVAYLPRTTVGYDLDRLSDHAFHPARPAPGPGEIESGGDHRLFWSLSFAVAATTWRRLGGFFEQYQGYGAEDTDLAMMALRDHIDLNWVGGAAAFHQWHPAGSPPLQHLDDILRNGAVFAQRWGWWPMEGWLAQFADLGLIEWSDEAAAWRRTAPQRENDATATPR